MRSSCQLASHLTSTFRHALQISNEFKLKAPIVIQVGGKLGPIKGQCPKGLSGFHDPKIHTAITISKEFGLEQSICTGTEAQVVSNDHYSSCRSEFFLLFCCSEPL